MADDKNIPRWHLGMTSAWFESGLKGPGTISGGGGDHGGVSYGTYQLSSAEKTVDEFIAQSAYKNDFRGLKPVTPQFDAKWRSLAESDPAFGDAQHQFIKASHYDRLVEQLNERGIDLSGRGSAVKDMVWSTAVQYRGYGPGVFQHAFEEKFGKHADLSKKSDVDIVDAVQSYKLETYKKYFSSSKPDWDGIKNRIEQESSDLKKFAETGIPVDRVGDYLAFQKKHDGFPDMKLGQRSGRINDLQEKLEKLGYAGPDGKALVNNDHRFGARTEHAVKEFQGANQLKVSGVVDRVTMEVVDRNVRNSQQAQDIWQQSLLRLDSPSHPDNALFKQAQGQIHELDRQQGRAPDHRSDNLAAALTVACRAEGISRIDKIAFSEGSADKLWAGQGMDGFRAAMDKLSHVDTVKAINTSIEQSSAQWPQAMQQFNQHQEQAQQRPSQSWEQAQQHAGPAMAR